MPKFYPLMINLEGRPILVVGGGPVGSRKAESFAPFGPRIVMVAKEPSARARELAARGVVELHERAYTDADLDEPLLVIAATNDRALDEHIKAQCDARRIPCNIVDITELCSFIVPSIIRRGELMITISTDGTCPSYSKYQRRRMEACCFPQGCERMLHAVAAAREELKGPLGEGMDDEEKFECLRGLVEDELPGRLEAEGEEAATAFAKARIHEIVAAWRAGE